MKKYVKPELFYEHFELTQHIAACGWNMQSADVNNCHAVPDKTGVWGDGFDVKLFAVAGVCEYTKWEDFCFESGASPDGVAFNS